MAENYPRRWPGKRWQIEYGSYEDVQQFAVEELQRLVQRLVPYVAECREGCHDHGNAGKQEPADRILVGTPENNAHIAERIAAGRLPAPPREQGYSLACLQEGEERVIAIAGYDDRGVLYGVEDLAAEVMNMPASEGMNPLDALATFTRSDYPRIDNRGIWTWGYVIYDYQRFIDHMARLRMNMLTMWNDCPPLNVREIIDYAHRRGVKIILGFHWGWGTDLDLAREKDRRTIKTHVIQEYRRHYRGLGMDGIYFQTLTEHHNTSQGGLSTAAAACFMVNETAAELLADEPELCIQFGLHAISIGERYTDLAELDPRVTIVWEDAGVIPFSYNPVTDAEHVGGQSVPESVRTIEQTVDYAKRLATFRPGTEFAMVPKGWITLRWDTEFEHHGPFILGRREPSYITRRLASRKDRWDEVNAQWLQNYPLALNFYREVLAARPSRMTVTGLVEDGMLEEAIQPSVALFGQTIWNPHQTAEEVLRKANSPYFSM